MDYNELRNRTGMKITHEQYNVIENVYLNTDLFKDVAAVVSFFKVHGFENAYEQILYQDHGVLKKACEELRQDIGALEDKLSEIHTAKNDALELANDYKAKYIDSRRELKEVTEAKDAKIAKLNALLDAYRQMVDVSKLDKDAIVMALARQ